MKVIAKPVEVAPTYTFGKLAIGDTCCFESPSIPISQQTLYLKSGDEQIVCIAASQQDVGTCGVQAGKVLDYRFYHREVYHVNKVELHEI